MNKETRDRMAKAVEQYLADLRWEFDEQQPDWHSESEQWAAIEQKVLVLLITAYRRNHT